MTNGGQPAGWHPDPWGQAAQRWWDGEQWTEHTDGAPVAAAPAAPLAAAPLAPVATGPAMPGYGSAPGFASVPTMAPPGGPVVSLDAHRNLLWVIVGGVVAVLLGSLMPWAEVTAPFVGQVSVNGMDGDGPLTLIAGAVAGGLALSAFLQRAARWKVIAAVVAAAIVAVIAVYDVVDVNSHAAEVEREQDIEVAASVGVGLWLVLLGGIVATVGCALTLPKIRRS